MKSGPKKRDLVGMSFGRWTVISEVPNHGRHVAWLCLCSCGNEREVLGFTLTTGASECCGCAQKEGGEATSNFRHGGTRGGSPIYNIWLQMRARCRHPQNRHFHLYGGRGIKVCDRWHDFANFNSDMIDTWSPGLTLERVDVNGNYEPSNCIWATQMEQMQNVRHAVYLDTPWGRLTVGAAARRIGVSRSALRERMKRGWATDKLLEPKKIKVVA